MFFLTLTILVPRICPAMLQQLLHLSLAALYPSASSFIVPCMIRFTRQGQKTHSGSPPQSLIKANKETEVKSIPLGIPGYRQTLLLPPSLTCSFLICPALFSLLLTPSVPLSFTAFNFFSFVFTYFPNSPIICFPFQLEMLKFYLSWGSCCASNSGKMEISFPALSFQ